MRANTARNGQKCMACRYRRVIKDSASECISMCAYRRGRKYLQPVCPLDTCEGYTGYLEDYTGYADESALAPAT